jgi:hypothetical protein
MRAAGLRSSLAGACLGLTVLALGGCGSQQASSGGGPATVPPSSTHSSTPPSTASSTSNLGSSPPPTSAHPTAPGPPSSAVTRSTVTAGATVTVTGVPHQGAEPSCLLLEKYLLIGGDRALLASGATVTVTGHTETGLMSYCQQGVYLVVDSVTRVR